MKGLVLEGGGAKGAFQIGAYRALTEEGIEFDGIAGTSIGALNGAFMVQNDIQLMENIWLNSDYKYFMDIDEETYQLVKDIDFKPKNFNLIMSLIKKARKNEGIDISPLRKNLEATINEDIIRNSNKDFGIVTVWWDRGINPHPIYIEDIPKGKLIDYLIASASLPVFNLDKMDGKLYLDGVFHDNMPINMLKNKGYEDIVVIRLEDDALGRKKLKEHTDINLTTIIPSEYLGGSLNLDKDFVNKKIDLGYFDTMKALKKYEGIKYYFLTNHKYDEDYCFELLKNMSIESIDNLKNVLGIKRETNTRVLLENIIPKIGELLELPTEFTYKDLIYRIYEKKLEETDINRLKLYDFNKVFDVVNKNINDNLEINDKLQKHKLLKSISNIIILDIKCRHL